MSSPSMEPGALLADRYRIETVLGVGGMSTVYRAHDEALSRTVAIKMFRDALSDPKALQRQRAEIQLIASLEHPALVTLFDAVAIDDAIDGVNTTEHAYLVMQFVDGVDLGAALARGPLPEDAAVAVIADVADALAAVHERGVIHRDVKPGNILVPRAPRPGGPRALLADFGIARFLDGLALTATGSVLGTANYLSPEQALGRELTTATDVYSLGLVLIEAISGGRAFPGAGMESVAARIGSDPVVPPAASTALAALARGMTQRDPAQRPSAERVAERLRELAVTAELPATVALAEIPDETALLPDSTASTATPTATTMPRHRPRRLFIAAAAVVLAALVAVIIAVTAPLSTPTSVSTPTVAPSGSSTGSSTPTAPTTATPVVVATPTTPTDPAPVTPPPGKQKPGPGKGNGNGNGHGKKP